MCTNRNSFEEAKKPLLKGRGVCSGTQRPVRLSGGPLKCFRPEMRYQTREMAAKPTKTTEASARQRCHGRMYERRFQHSQFMAWAVTGRPVGNESSGMASRNQQMDTLSVSRRPKTATAIDRAKIRPGVALTRCR